MHLSSFDVEKIIRMDERLNGDGPTEGRTRRLIESLRLIITMIWMNQYDFQIDESKCFYESFSRSNDVKTVVLKLAFIG